MVREEFEKLLHKVTKHTNLMIPHSDYITATEFPEQISELLNTTISLYYRDHRYTDNEILRKEATKYYKGEEISSRPSDDTEFVPRPYGPEDIEQPNDLFFKEFIVLRADTTAPYRFIAVSTDYNVMIISSTEIEPVTQRYKFLDIVPVYPTQMNEYIGLAVYNKYPGEIPEIPAVTLRVDATEPCYSVLMEILGSTGTVRFLLGDEIVTRIQDYFDPNGLHDYNGAGPTEESSEYTDIDGYSAADPHIVDALDVNGGGANPFVKLYHEAMTDEELRSFREGALTSYTFYGSDTESPVEEVR